MKVELIDEKVFTIKFGDTKFCGMRRVSEWNGLVEFRNSVGEVLIVSAPECSSFGAAFDTLFGEIFRNAQQTKAAGAKVVMGSPALLAQLRPPSAEAAADGDAHAR